MHIIVQNWNVFWWISRCILFESFFYCSKFLSFRLRQRKTFLYNLRNFLPRCVVMQKFFSSTKLTLFSVCSLPPFTASVSVRSIRNIPKVPLTVKPDPNDTLNRSLNGGIGGNANNFYYDNNSFKKQSDEVNSLYINGQAQQQGISIHQDPQHHQYAVVKKTGSKRDIRENLERENSAMFKVRFSSTFAALLPM